MSNTELYKKAISKFGRENQIIKAIEELGELTVELSKYLGKQSSIVFDVDKVATEITDVLIMLEQLAIIFDCEVELEYFRSLKLERLLGLVEAPDDESLK